MQAWIWQILPAREVLSCYWPRRSSNSSFYSVSGYALYVSKLHGGGGKVEIDLSYQILPFFLKPPEEASIQEMFWCLWQWTNRPQEEWQKQHKICAEGFGASLSAFLNRSAHPGFFPNSILITCSQIVVFFQTACSFIIKEPAISDSIIESYIVYKNWYSE